MVERRYLKNFDFTLFFATLIIIIYGCATLYSASKGSSGASLVQRQIIWAIIGLIGGGIVASINHSVYTQYAGRLYAITIIILLLVLKMGESAKGAQRWIGFGPIQIQPSEFAKVALIIALAVFLVKHREEIRSLKVFLYSFLYLAVPMILIFKQPDLGTSLVLLAIWIMMTFIMGTDIKNIILFVSGIILLGIIAWTVPGIMKSYQKDRVAVFINPSADMKDRGYHVNQSRIAIGSGQIWGKGFKRGTQRELNFVPEQHTDFIFTVVGEELGFVGSASLILLYFIVLWRGVQIMAVAEDDLGRAIATGVVGMLSFHVIVNAGMTMGIMPVTGVPLPMFSYGGSSLMANMMAIGLLQGISMRRHKISF